MKSNSHKALFKCLNFIKPSSINQSEINLSIRDEINQVSPQKVQSYSNSSINQDEKIVGFSNAIWRTKSLKIIYIITKFFIFLYQKTEKCKLRQITSQIFDQINDQSSDYDYFLMRKMIKGKISIWRNCKINFKAIQPDNYLKILWDVVVVFFIVLNIFYIPMKLAFSIEDTQNQYIAFFLDDVPSWVFLIEILINFNTAYYEKGEINNNRKEIIMNYLKTDFIIDTIVVIPFIISQYNIPYVDFLLLLRVARVKALFENIEEVLNLREKFSTVVDLIKLIYFVLFVSHFCACAWYYFALNEKGTSWVTVELINPTTSSRYINSLYWSTITLLTVGYGDIVPVNENEKVFVIVMSLITCGVFGYAISSIGAIFKEIEDKKERKKTQISMITLHLKKNQLSKQLRLKVKKYFDYYYEKQEDEAEKINQMLNQLTPEIKRQVMIDMNKKFLKDSQILSTSFSDQFLDELCQYLKEKKCLPGEIIYQKDQTVNSLYWIREGQLQIGFDKAEKNISSILSFKRGEIFGEHLFFSQKSSQYQVAAGEFTQLLYLSYNDFIKVIRQFPIDFEKFCTKRDFFVDENRFKIDFCELCKGQHQFKNCPFSFWQANRQKLIYNLNFSSDQNRKKRSRRPSVKKQSLAILQQASLALCLNEGFLQENLLDDGYMAKLGFEAEYEKKDSLFESSLSALNNNSNNELMKKVTIHEENNEEFQIQKQTSLSDNISELTNQKKGILKKLQVNPDILNQEHLEGNQETQNISSYIYSYLYQYFLINRRNPQRKSSRVLHYENVNQYLSKKLNYSGSVKSFDTQESKYFNLTRNDTILNSNTNNDTFTNETIPLKNHCCNLDKGKNYEIYFPHFNLAKVLQNICDQQNAKQDEVSVVYDRSKKNTKLNLLKRQNNINQEQLNQFRIESELQSRKEQDCFSSPKTYFL